MASVMTETTRPGFRADDGPQGRPDEWLLGQFLGGDDADAEAAFEALVRRHGPMVLGVCRHVLGQPHDAEDAFQATFLVLARKAGSIRDRRVLGRWLYEVAYRIAVRSRAHAARRRAHERQGAEMSAVAHGPETDPAWTELRPVLHEEVNRLPEKYRSAVVLCYLEGRTNEEAAALLDWPVGTVKGRLFRAREMLRSRLTRRGLALSAAFLAARLSQSAVFAEVVPASLSETTARAAVSAARGVGGVAGAAAPPSRAWEMADDCLRSWPAPARMTGRAVAVTILVVLVALLLGVYGSGWGAVRAADLSSFLPSLLTPNGGAPGGCH